MQYNQFGTLGKTSRLGFGMMRLPCLEDGSVDEERAVRMIRRGIDGGINYVDTAYPYHGGMSEKVVGRALKDGYREKTFLTTKLPCWKVESRRDMDTLFDEQLKRLDVPCVDMYLLHALNGERYEKMKELGCQDFFEHALKDGRVRHVGFSFHDSHESFRKILLDYDAWEMCQVQYNYLDDEYQAGREGIRLAEERKVPVVIMEPLRGGALAKVPSDVQAAMDARAEKRSPAEWAFRFAGNPTGVKVVLSGMSDEKALEENLDIFDRVFPGNLTAEEDAFCMELKRIFLARRPVMCTACRYCQPCPQGVRIPEIFAAVNRAVMLDRREDFERSYAALAREEGDASRCVGCGTCEAACPQGLDIIELLRKADERVLTGGRA